MNSTYEQGAHFVLGTTKKTCVNDSDNFLSGFLRKLAGGSNIEECIAEGLDAAGDQVKDPDTDIIIGQYPITYRGDTSQFLQ